MSENDQPHPPAGTQFQRNLLIFQRYTAGETQTGLAAEYGISVQAVSAIVARIRKHYRRPREDIVAEHFAEAVKIRETLAAMAFSPNAAAAVAGKDGSLIPVLDEDGQVIPGRYAHDVSAKLDALRGLVSTQAHVNKMLGLNAPDKVQQDVTVNYVLEGVNPDEAL